MKSKILGTFVGILVAVSFLMSIGEMLGKAKPECIMPGCSNEQTSGSKYCVMHDLSYRTYGNPDYQAVYRQSQERQKKALNAIKTNSANKANVSGKSGSSSGSSGNSNRNSGSGSSKNSRSGGVSAKTGTSSKSYSVDPYDADEFDNADDFADEWAEEFGDGDFEEGYEDAYDYWEEYAN